MLFSGLPATPLRVDNGDARKRVEEQDLLMSFANRQRLRNYGRDEIILAEGQTTTHVFITTRGWIMAHRDSPEGRRQIISFGLPGELCCTSLHSQTPLAHSIRAITPATIAILGKAEFRAILTGNAPLSRAFWKRQQAAMAIQQRWTFMLGMLGATERLAHLLCEIFVRQKPHAHAAETEEAKRTCLLPLTQTQIGQACGLTQVHTNRTLQALRRQNVIKLENRTLTVLDFDELAELGSYDPGYLDCRSMPGH